MKICVAVALGISCAVALSSLIGAVFRIYSPTEHSKALQKRQDPGIGDESMEAHLVIVSRRVLMQLDQFMLIFIVLLNLLYWTFK